MLNDSIVFHLPHASLLIPREERGGFLVDDQALELTNKIITDLYVDDFFATLVSGGVVVKAECSRLVVDVERFVDDNQEIMSRVGMGAVYIKDHNGRLIRKIDDNQRQMIIEKYYQPHHQKLEKAVVDNLAKYDNCLILDLHSFASKPLDCDNNQTDYRADVCLGYDEFHVPSDVIQAIEDKIKKLGLAVSHNSPFAGSIVPLRFYRKDNRVKSLMIEINKRIYMNEVTFTKRKQFDKISKLVCGAIQQVIRT